MSFYLYAEINTGDDYYVIEEIVSGCTHNLHPIFRAALGCNIRDLHERPCHDVIELTQRAYEYAMAQENRAALLALEPPNKWGDLASAQGVLASLAHACRRHPKCRLRYSG